jgi:WD40 repeat protein
MIQPRRVLTIPRAGQYDPQTRIRAAAVAGSRIVTLEQGGLLSLWSAASGDPVHVHHSFTDLTGMIANERFVALYSSENATFVLDLDEPRTGWRKGPRIEGRFLRFVSPTRIALFSASSSMVVFDATDQKIVDGCGLDDVGPESSVAISEDGRSLVIGSAERVRVLDRVGRRCIWEERIPDPRPGRGERVAVAINGGRVAWASSRRLELREIGGRVLFSESEKVADCESLFLQPDGTVILEHRDRDRGALILAFAPNGSIQSELRPLPDQGTLIGLVTEGNDELLVFVADSRLVLRRVADGEALVHCRPDGHREAIRAMAFGADGTLITAAERVCVWGAAGELCREFGGPVGPYSTVLSRDGRFAATHQQGKLRLWDCAEGKLVREIDSGGLRARTPAALSKDGRFVVLAGVVGHPDPMTIAHFDGRMVERDLVDEDDGGDASAALAPDDSFVITAGAFGDTRRFALDGELQETIGGWSRGYALFVTADGTRVLVGCDSFEVRIAKVDGPTAEVYGGDAPDGAEQDQDAGIYAVAASDDLTLVAAGGSQRYMRVWYYGEPEVLEVGDTVTAVAVEPNGRRVAIGGLSGRIEIWQM